MGLQVKWSRVGWVRQSCMASQSAKILRMGEIGSEIQELLLKYSVGNFL
jgi:hypothetical protein